MCSVIYYKYLYFYYVIFAFLLCNFRFFLLTDLHLRIHINSKRLDINKKKIRYKQCNVYLYEDAKAKMFYYYRLYKFE